MENPGVRIFVIVVAIFLFLFAYFKYFERKNRLEFILKVKREWGKVPTKEYSYEQLDGIKRYFEGKAEGKFYIDDITWNDLDMDSIFMLLNNTNSSIGEQYLYYMLRTPSFQNEELEERKKIIDYFEQNEEARIKLQCMYGAIGKIGKYSVTDYIYNLADLDKKSNWKEYGMFLLGVLSIVAALTIPAYGVAILLFAIIVNISQYYRCKGEVEPYFTSIAYISRLLLATETFEKTLPENMKEYADKVNQAKKHFVNFRRKARWIKAGKNATGSIEEALLDYIKIFFHVDLIVFNHLLTTVKENLEYIDILIETMGSIEAYMAIASFRGTRQFYAIPKLHQEQKQPLDIVDVYHPMIQEPVLNSIKEDTCVLITGSNASGKSTFLKTIAVNAILAQTIYMVMARTYSSCFYRVYSSMALTDNLMSNESYYIVEIKSLKRILDASQEETPILCFIDEVLRGTNTIERIAASAQILKSLHEEQIMCFAATHDIELTHILEKFYHNYHFEEEVQDDDILFNYELRTGRATSRNAIKLLSIIGFEKEIIQKAMGAAEEFTQLNHWRSLE